MTQGNGMNLPLAIAPIADAWNHFHAISHVGHITDDQDYEASIKLADALISEGAMEETHPQYSLFMTLNDLIYAYDQRHDAMSAPQSAQVLRFLMEQHGLKLAQLPEIGRQSEVSEILAGKRSLTANHIRSLSARFGINPNAFF
jgi:HTH-type transcriptional regulator/antitoxin HigA